MKSLDHKLIIYDSNCRVCSSMKNILLAVTSIDDKKVKAFNDLSPSLKHTVDPERFKNEMALIDMETNETLYGPYGIAYIFSSKSKIFDLLFRSTFIFRIFRFFYRTLAYNRYFVALPKNGIACDCFPDNVLKFRFSYIFITILLSVVMTLLFGISLKAHFGITATQAGIEMLLIAGSGWVVQIFLASILLKKEAFDYIAHLGSIMVVGLLILMPVILFYFISGILNVYIPIVSVAFSSGYMLYMHIHRIRFLQLSQLWTGSWFLCLQFTAAYWIYYFHLSKYN